MLTHACDHPHALEHAAICALLTLQLGRVSPLRGEGSSSRLRDTRRLRILRMPQSMKLIATDMRSCGSVGSAAGALAIACILFYRVDAKEKACRIRTGRGTGAHPDPRVFECFRTRTAHAAVNRYIPNRQMFDLQSRDRCELSRNSAGVRMDTAAVMRVEQLQVMLEPRNVRLWQEDTFEG